MENNELENQNEVVETTPVITETTETPQNEVPWFAAFGYESEDVFKSDFEQLKSYKTRAEEIQTKEREIQEGLSLLQEADDPFAGIEEAKTLVAFGKKGIPSSLANQIVNATPESLMEDPLNTLILAEAIKNPTKFKQLGRETIEEAIREKYNIGTTGNYYPTALMKSDAIDAIEIVQGTKKDVETIKNPFTFAKELKAQSEKTFADRQSLALGEAESYSKQLKELPYKFGDSEVSLQVSSEEIDEILKSQRAGFLGRAFDATTKEGKQAVRDWLSYEVLAHKLQSGDLGVQIAKTLSAQVEKKVVKEVYNGQPKTVNRVDKTALDTKNLTPAQKDLIERGIPLPSQQLKV
jgi:hypothetical protein